LFWNHWEKKRKGARGKINGKRGEKARGDHTGGGTKFFGGGTGGKKGGFSGGAELLLKQKKKTTTNNKQFFRLCVGCHCTGKNVGLGREKALTNKKTKKRVGGGPHFLGGGAPIFGCRFIFFSFAVHPLSVRGGLALIVFPKTVFFSKRGYGEKKKNGGGGGNKKAGFLSPGPQGGGLFFAILPSFPKKKNKSGPACQPFPCLKNSGGIKWGGGNFKAILFAGLDGERPASQKKIWLFGPFPGGRLSSMGHWGGDWGAFFSEGGGGEGGRGEGNNRGKKQEKNLSVRTAKPGPPRGEFLGGTGQKLFAEKTPTNPPHRRLPFSGGGKGFRGPLKPGAAGFYRGCHPGGGRGKTKKKKYKGEVDEGALKTEKWGDMGGAVQQRRFGGGQQKKQKNVVTFKQSFFTDWRN